MAEQKELSRRDFGRAVLAFLGGSAVVYAGARVLDEGVKKIIELSENERMDQAKAMLQDAQYILKNNPDLSFKNIRSLNGITLLRNGKQEKMRTSGYSTKPQEDTFLNINFYGGDHTVWIHGRLENETDHHIAPFQFFDDTSPVIPDQLAVEEYYNLPGGSLTATYKEQK